MLIPKTEAKLFFELYPSLIGYAAAKSGHGSIKDRDSFMNSEGEERVAARNVLYDNTAVMNQYMVPFIPILMTTVLLPWKDRIVCDGLFSYKSISFGSGMRSGFKDQYMVAKRRGLILSSEELIRAIKEDDKSENKLRLRAKSNRTASRSACFG